MYRPHVWCCICPNPAVAEVLAEKTGYRNTQKKKELQQGKTFLACQPLPNYISHDAVLTAKGQKSPILGPQKRNLSTSSGKE